MARQLPWADHDVSAAEIRGRGETTITITESVSFGHVLRQLRLAAGLTQEALAERSGVSARAVSELERDPARTPRLSSVTLLADALGISAADRARLLAAARPEPTPAAQLPPSQTLRPEWPQPLTPLFGRDGVVEAVAALLRRGDQPASDRLITLTGPGGVGKTRLAIAAAERMAAAFADGLVFVDLAPVRDPSLVLAAIDRPLAIDESGQRSLAERLTMALRRQQRLVVLDNFEHLLAARDQVRGLLETCPHLVVLVTSRVPLRMRGERVYRIAPLELPDPASAPELLARSPAVALFLDRARAAGAELALTPITAPAISEICRRLDGLPLAVELAAAWTPLLPPPRLLERLAPRLPLLVGRSHDLPTRQQTMRDTIAWSYELLDPDQQRLFRRLCVFAGGCTLEAAAAICEEDEPTVLRKLADLLDHNLLRSQTAVPALTEPRITMLETIREYGLEQLAACGRTETAHQRHAAYYLALAETAATGLTGPDGASWSARLEQEHDNLRAALGWALAQGEGEVALRLVGALWRFWSERGHLSEGRRWLQSALANPMAGGESQSRARVTALIGAAQLAIEQGAYDAAAPACVEAVALARALTTPTDLVLALNTYGCLLQERGDYPAANRCYEEALALGRSVDDRSGQAAALLGLGYVTIWAGDVAQGGKFFEHGLAMFRAAGNTRGLADGLIGVATASVHAGGFARAESAATEALALFRGLGDTGRIAEALWTLGVTAQFQEQSERAVPLHEENLALRRARGDAHGAIQPLTALAMIASRQGDSRHARVLLGETFAILEQFDDPWSRAMSLTLLGHVDLAQGDPAAAMIQFAAAASLYQTIGNLLYLPWCLEGLAGVAAVREDWLLTARLSGVRDALQTRLGLGLPPFDPVAYARVVDASRDHLDADRFATVREAGQGSTIDEAIAAAVNANQSEIATI